MTNNPKIRTARFICCQSIVCGISFTLFSALLFGLRSSPGFSQERTATSNQSAVRVIRDIEYAKVDDTRLLLDLHLPEGFQRPPLIVWVHGGAWRSGSKKEMPLSDLLRSGFAVASVDYRLSPVAKFPAQIHDCKAAIRFLRYAADQYGYNATRIGIGGSSAGGHLVALIGVTNNLPELEGAIGDHRDQSSSIQAILDMYGPTNFLTILKQSTPHGLSVREPAFDLLLGGQPDKLETLARLASPVFQVDANDPPLLIIHGDQDPQVPINQSHELHETYKSKKLDVQFEVVHGAGHGGAGFFDDHRKQLMREFFIRTLK